MEILRRAQKHDSYSWRYTTLRRSFLSSHCFAVLATVQVCQERVAAATSQVLGQPTKGLE